MHAITRQLSQLRSAAKGPKSSKALGQVASRGMSNSESGMQGAVRATVGSAQSKPVGSRAGLVDLRRPRVEMNRSGYATSPPPILKQMPAPAKINTSSNDPGFLRTNQYDYRYQSAAGDAGSILRNRRRGLDRI